MYPLKFEPIFKTIVWGGEKIAPYKGVETEQEHIGESWELSGVKGNESVVANGALKGRTIADLVKEYKGRLVGEHVYANTGDEFPLLIKFIDALSDLSVQVHPNDELAAVRHNGSKGKTEMWYVVDAEPGAHLLAGMTEEITPEEYERRVADGTITEVLARHDVHPGDVFFLPAGRIHAICGGCFIAEIQQTSAASTTTAGWAWTASRASSTRSSRRTPSTTRSIRSTGPRTRPSRMRRPSWFPASTSPPACTSWTRPCTRNSPISTPSSW